MRGRGALLAACGLLVGCHVPVLAAVERVPWSSLPELLQQVSSWPRASDAAAPWAFEVLVPDELDEAARARLAAAWRARGYAAVHDSPAMVGEVTSYAVRLVLADPVQLPIETRAAARQLWQAGVPFGTTAGNSPWLLLPRRAIPAARAALGGAVPDAAWQRMTPLLPAAAAPRDRAR